MLRFPDEADRIRELNIAAQDLKDQALELATEAHMLWNELREQQLTGTSA